MRQVSAETVEWFGTACKGGELTRTALARELCGREGWHNRAGRPCLASARKPHMRPPRDFPDVSVADPLRELGALSLDPVADAEDRRRWEAMIETHHPEGWRLFFH